MWDFCRVAEQIFYPFPGLFYSFQVVFVSMPFSNLPSWFRIRYGYGTYTIRKRTGIQSIFLLFRIIVIISSLAKIQCKKIFLFCLTNKHLGDCQLLQQFVRLIFFITLRCSCICIWFYTVKYHIPVPN